MRFAGKVTSNGKYAAVRRVKNRNINLHAINNANDEFLPPHFQIESRDVTKLSDGFMHYYLLQKYLLKLFALKKLNYIYNCNDPIIIAIRLKVSRFYFAQ